MERSRRVEDKMKTIATTVLNEGENVKKTISLVSDNASRGFNVRVSYINSNAQKTSPAPDYQFPTMINEEKAREAYTKLTTN